MAKSPKRVDDLPDYVAAFKTSSDRARFAFYVVIVATVLIFITNYNVQQNNWPRQRLRKWFTTASASAKPADGVVATNAKQLEILREEYLRQFAGRALFTESPIPGVSIDANDLGILGGIALVLVMLVFVLSVIREHENLYLAFFKLREVCRDEGDKRDEGESDSNLLYHSLAMSQVFSSPPTLARWKRQGVLQHFGIAFFAPAAVYFWVVYSDWSTQGAGRDYGVDVDRQLFIEIIFLAILIILCTSAWLQARAMSKRWERAFFRVNPRRRIVDQMSDGDWLKLPTRGGLKDATAARLATLLVDGIREKAVTKTMTVPVTPVEKEIKNGHVSRKVLLNVTKTLHEDGVNSARQWCSANHAVFVELEKFVVATNEVTDHWWVVDGHWEFSYTRKP